MSKENRTIAILVNYNNFEDTIEAVLSLLKQSVELYKIIVVDNCSSNDSFDKLSIKFEKEERVKILKSDKNGGFAYGNNYGIKYAEKNYQFDFFILINNDTISDKNINMYFIEYYNKNSSNMNIGILTGKMYYYDEPNILWYAGGYFNKLRCSGYHIGDGEEDRGQYDKEKEVSFATGCLWFFHKSLINKIGYLPEEYFMYLEDVDYSIKANINGLKIIFLPNIKIWHKIGKSSNDTKNTPKFYYNNRNRIILAKKYLPFFYRKYFYIFLFITRGIWILKLLIKEKKIINTFKGVFKRENR